MPLSLPAFALAAAFAPSTSSRPWSRRGRALGPEPRSTRPEPSDRDHGRLARRRRCSAEHRALLRIVSRRRMSAFTPAYGRFATTRTRVTEPAEGVEVDLDDRDPRSGEACAAVQPLLASGAAPRRAPGLRSAPAMRSARRRRHRGPRRRHGLAPAWRPRAGRPSQAGAGAIPSAAAGPRPRRTMTMYVTMVATLGNVGVLGRLDYGRLLAEAARPPTSTTPTAPTSETAAVTRAARFQPATSAAAVSSPEGAATTDTMVTPSADPR